MTTRLPPAMPDWSPVRSFGGYGNWAEDGRQSASCRAHAMRTAVAPTPVRVHGHDHARAWSSRLPVSDLKSFWGALGCACWAV